LLEPSPCFRIAEYSATVFLKNCGSLWYSVINQGAKKGAHPDPDYESTIAECLAWLMAHCSANWDGARWPSEECGQNLL